jgi:hypothetical protein
MMPAIPRPSLVLMLAASVPMPCMGQSWPAVDGIVLESGQPATGVALFFGKYPGKNEPCSRSGCCDRQADGRVHPSSCEGRADRSDAVHEAA